VLNRGEFLRARPHDPQVFNQNLAAPPNAGWPNSTATTSRQIQLALKFIW
jgi:hypothetical protein